MRRVLGTTRCRIEGTDDMPFDKRIVCLANSRKWSQRCVAGKELCNDAPGPWVRPVSRQECGELSLSAMCFQRGGIPRLLDIVVVPLLRHTPHAYQTENYLVDGTRRWRKEGELKPAALRRLCDPVTSLWVNGYHSHSGQNDRAPQTIVETEVTNSLVLIKPQTLGILVNKREVRASFRFADEEYRLKVTDPEIEKEYLMCADGFHPVDKDDVYLCVSLGEPYRDYCYKLVASVINLL